MSRKFQLLEKATAEISNGNLNYTIEIPGTDNFTTLANAFNKMRLSLKEEKERENRFIMGISHDLKTPLTLIGGYAEALADDMGQSGEDREKYYLIIRQKLNDLDNKIDTLIDYRKMETGEWKKSLSKIQLAELLVETCSLIEEDSEFMAIKFSSEINIPPEYTAHIDTGLFSRAIDNIISNSIRYTPKGGSINLSAYIRQEKAVIEIVDSGKGIPPGELKKVTEPFFRGTKSRREQGFGLGLSIVKSVADTHSWILKIESADGGGTRIAISGI
jgi:signal transduction histidine kinase